MGNVKVGDRVKVIKAGQPVDGEVTFVASNGQISIKLDDGSTLTNVPHTSKVGQGSGWYSGEKGEALSREQKDPDAIALGEADSEQQQGRQDQGTDDPSRSKK